MCNTMPTLIYRVTVFRVALGRDGKKTETVHHSRDFWRDDILHCREEAFKYFGKMAQAYIYTSVTPQDSKWEAIFPYFICLYFVHRLPPYKEQVYTLMGGSEEECEKGNDPS